MNPLELFLGALIIGKVWNNQKNPPKYYNAEGKRIHHYHLGLAGLGLAGLLYLSKNKRLAKNIAAFSSGLILDDHEDFKKDILDRTRLDVLLIKFLK